MRFVVKFRTFVTFLCRKCAIAQLYPINILSLYLLFICYLPPSSYRKCQHFCCFKSLFFPVANKRCPIGANRSLGALFFQKTPRGGGGAGFERGLYSKGGLIFSIETSIFHTFQDDCFWRSAFPFLHVSTLTPEGQSDPVPPIWIL